MLRVAQTSRYRDCGDACGTGGGDVKAKRAFIRISSIGYKDMTQTMTVSTLTCRTGTSSQAAAEQQARLAFHGGAITRRPAAGECRAQGSASWALPPTMQAACASHGNTADSCLKPSSHGASSASQVRQSDVSNAE